MIYRPICPSCGKELSAAVVFDYLRRLSEQCTSLRAELSEHPTMVGREEKHGLWGME